MKPARQRHVAPELEVGNRVQPVGRPGMPRCEGQIAWLNIARGAYLKELGNTPGHLNHWSKRSFAQLLGRYGTVVEARSPFPWTMLLVRLA